VLDDDIERSGWIGPGDTYAMVFDNPGQYRYSCCPHPAMKGAIVVE
jgi:plastocyanin